MRKELVDIIKIMAVRDSLQDSNYFKAQTLKTGKNILKVDL
jgi:hypothetical protein